MTSHLNGCPHFLHLFFSIFIKLIVTCRLCVTCVREDNGYTAYKDYMYPDVCCLKKAVKFNHSLTPNLALKFILVWWKSPLILGAITLEL